MQTQPRIDKTRGFIMNEQQSTESSKLKAMKKKHDKMKNELELKFSSLSDKIKKQAFAIKKETASEKAKVNLSIRKNRNFALMTLGIMLEQELKNKKQNKADIIEKINETFSGDTPKTNPKRRQATINYINSLI